MAPKWTVFIVSSPCHANTVAWNQRLARHCKNVIQYKYQNEIWKLALHMTVLQASFPEHHLKNQANTNFGELAAQWISRNRGNGWWRTHEWVGLKFDGRQHCSISQGMMENKNCSRSQGMTGNKTALDGRVYDYRPKHYFIHRCGNVF
jgi:hypothetical protein